MADEYCAQDEKREEKNYPLKMLAKKFRLTAKKDFQSVYRNKKTYHTPFFSGKYVLNHLTYSRLAVVVAKKNIKQAVSRNKIKRRIKAILHKQWPLLLKNIDLIIFVKKDINKLKFADLEKTMTSFFTKENIVKKEETDEKNN